MAQAEELLERFDNAMSEDIDFDGDFITLADFEKVFDDEKFLAPAVSSHQSSWSCQLYSLNVDMCIETSENNQLTIHHVDQQRFSGQFCYVKLIAGGDSDAISSVTFMICSQYS